MKNRYKFATRSSLLAITLFLPFASKAVDITNISQVNVSDTYCAANGLSITGEQVLLAWDSYISDNPGGTWLGFLADNSLTQTDIQNGFVCGAVIAQVQRQEARTLTTGIQQIIKFQMLESFDKENGGGGSGDTNSSRDWNYWITPTFTSFESKIGHSFRDSTDLYQLTFGGDTKIDQFLLGVSGSYSRTDAETTDGDHEARVAPYASYSFTRNLYATAIAGYNARKVDHYDRSGNGLFTDIALNYILPIDQLFLIGKAGHRFSWFYKFANGEGGDEDSWDNTYYLSGEVLYKFGNFMPYINATWEHFDPEDLHDDTDDAFLKLGFQYAVKNDMTLGLAYQTEISGRAEDKDVYYNQASMDIRIRF